MISITVKNFWPGDIRRKYLSSQNRSTPRDLLTPIQHPIPSHIRSLAHTNTASLITSITCAVA